MKNGFNCLLMHSLDIIFGQMFDKQIKIKNMEKRNKQFHENPILGFKESNINKIY